LELILILFVIAAYAPVWKAGFVWDDSVILTANPCIIGPLGLKEIWTTSAADICPLTLTTFWAEHVLWGLNPLPYHLVNVLLHGLSAVVLWRVLRGLRIQGAWLGAALWALHPVAVESVAWITEMKNTESGLFFLLSILFFVRWINPAGAGYDSEREHAGSSSIPTLPARNASAWADPGGRYSITPASSTSTSTSRSTSTIFLKRCLDERTGGGWSYVLSLLFAALAMAAKSSTVILPVVLCLCAWWIEGRWHWRNLVSCPRNRHFFRCDQNGAPARHEEGAYQNGYVTDEQRRRRPIFIATLWATVSWLFFRVARSSRIDSDMLVPTASPAQTALKNSQLTGGERRAYFGDRTLTRTVPLFLMAIAVSALSIWTQGLQLATGSDPQWARNWPERLAAAGDAVWFYLGKLLWPHPLSANYPRWQIDAGQWVSYLPLLAVIVILAIFWLRGRSGGAGSRACFFAFAYFTMALLPVLGLIDNYIFRYSLVFDHFQYLASIGPLALAGTALDRLSDFMIPKRPWLQSALCVGLLLILGMASWQRTWVYESEVALWSDTLARNPDSWAAHNDLGNAFIQKGQVEGALVQYQKALQINPNDLEALNNLGVALFRKGRMDDAVAQYQKALAISPNYVLTHNNLGNALLQRGQLDDAVAHYQKALEINPNFAGAHYNLGNALFQKGRVDDAMAHYQKALEINPNRPEAHYNLANTLIQKGQMHDAVAHYQKALEINPNYPEAHNNLGNALLQRGQLDDAVAHYQKALEINPNFPEARYNLGKAFIQKGQLDSAITQFQEVLRLKPDFRPAQDDLNHAEALVRQLEGHN
jgi:tetratricopeptide (TPR) repeat protein